MNAIELAVWHVQELTALLKRCETDEKGIPASPAAAARIAIRLHEAEEALRASRSHAVTKRREIRPSPRVLELKRENGAYEV